MLSRFTSRVFVRSYLKTLSASLPPPMGASVSARVMERVPETVEDEISRDGNNGGNSQRLWLTMCASVLHADEALTESCERSSTKTQQSALSSHADTEAICRNPSARQRLLAQALMDIPMAKYYNSKMGFIASMLGSNAKEQLRGLFSPRIARYSERLLGGMVDLSSSQHNQAGDDDDDDDSSSSSSLVVTRCNFHQFFVKHERPDLTTVICLADTAWMHSLANDPRSFITCRRPSTISTGGSKCVFELVPKKTTSDTNMDDVVQEKLNKTDN